MSAGAREARIAAVVCGVLRQALLDAGTRSIVVLRNGTPEGTLLRQWIERELADGALVDEADGNALVADPANKTTLLLEPQRMVAPLYPLGDLYASQVARLAGGWSGGPVCDAVATACGGIDLLDRALQRHIDARVDRATAFASLDAAAAQALGAALDAARFGRRRPGLVPKLGARTLGIDLFS